MGSRAFRIACAVLLLVLVSGVVWRTGRRHRRLDTCLSNLFRMSATQYSPALGRTYSTNFPKTEKMISENHNCVNGGANPLSGAMGRTYKLSLAWHLARNREPFLSHIPLQEALVTGSRGSDQFVQIVDEIPQLNYIRSNCGYIHI
jgi:hypothetical protein